jgi:FMN phosphatase YigB (HAD superfamily)
MGIVGITELVDQILSIEDVSLLMPRPELELAVEQARVQPGEAMLIATHLWDINGAKAAELLAAMAAREGFIQKQQTSRNSRCGTDTLKPFSVMQTGA